MTIYDAPGLYGLELWRGTSGIGTLFELRDRKPEYFLALREFLVRLHYGEAASVDEGETDTLQQAAGFVRVVFCGGEALHPLFKPILHAEALPFAAEVDTGGPYSAKKGALRIFQAMGWRRGVALDLGQMQLKVMTAPENRTLVRDVSQLPFGAEAVDASLGRARLRSFIQDGLSRAVDGNDAPDGIVLALPAALGRDGVAQPATYPGLFGQVQPIFAGLFACPCVVLNDAVLAALGFPPASGEKSLVVTLGFGVGGALWAT